MLMNIKNKIKRITAIYKTNNPFEIASAKDIDVRYEDLGMAIGFTDTCFRITTIHINCNIPRPLAKFVCAHELGHIYLHKDLNIPYFTRRTFYSQSSYEREANTFAVELLLPNREIHSGQTLQELSRLFGIPKELIGLKRLI